MGVIGPIIGGIAAAAGSIIGGNQAAEAAEEATEQQVAAQQQALRFQQEQLALNRTNIDAATAAALGELNVPFGGGFGGPGAAPLQESPELVQARQAVQALEQQMSEARAGVGGQFGEFLDKMTEEAFLPGAAPASGGLGQLQKARAEVTRLEGLHRQATIDQAGAVPFGGQTSFQRVRQLQEQGPGELTPQQQREFGRGIEALQAGFSRTSGGGVSSRALERAQQFGQDFASRRFNQELERAAFLLPAELGRGQSAADIRLRGAAAGAGVGLGAAPGISATFGNIGGLQAQGTVAQQNAFANTLSGIFGPQGQVADLIQNPAVQGLFSSRRPQQTGFGTPFGSKQGQNLFGPQFT